MTENGTVESTVIWRMFAEGEVEALVTLARAGNREAGEVLLVAFQEDGAVPGSVLFDHFDDAFGQILCGENAEKALCIKLPRGKRRTVTKQIRDFQIAMRVGGSMEMHKIKTLSHKERLTDAIGETAEKLGFSVKTIERAVQRYRSDLLKPPEEVDKR